MKQNKRRVWVHPDFQKMLKRMAVEKDTTLTELTRRLAHDDDFFEENKQRRRKYGFDF